MHTIILASCNRYVFTTEVTSGTIVHRAKPMKRLAAQIEFWICIVLYGKACVGVELVTMQLGWDASGPRIDPCRI